MLAQIPNKIIVRNSHNVYNGKVARPKMHTLTDEATGKPYDVPDDDYRLMQGQGKSDKDIEKLVAQSFGGNDFEACDVRATGGDTGHIVRIEYAPGTKVLRVTFRKPSREGQIVAYLNVPTAVAGELLHLAASNNTQVSARDGKLRHVLGMRFWDLVRIRGTVGGSRYSFKYVDDMTKDGKDSYVRGTATPDWGRTKFILTKKAGSNQYVPKAISSLNPKERSDYDGRVNIAKQSVGKDAGYDVDTMFAIVNKTNIEENAKSSILRNMESMRKDSDAGLTIYNYLRIMGLL